MGTRKKTRSTRSQPKSAALRVVDMGNQIWLAGLGALARAQKEGPKLFEELVDEGRELQGHTRDAAKGAIDNVLDEVRSTLKSRAGSVRDTASETWDNVEKIFQSRVHKALQQLGVPSAREINALARKVNELNRNVEQLARTRGASRRTAAPRRNARHSGQHEASSGMV